MEKLNKELIESLKCGGNFKFLVTVKTEYNNGFTFCSPNGREETRRIDTIQLKANDVDDIEIQSELLDYFKDNNVKEVLLDGKVVWKNTKKKLIIGEHCLTCY